MSEKKWNTMPYNGRFGFAVSEEYKNKKIIPYPQIVIPIKIIE